MRRLTSIVAVNEDGVIGAGNALPWRIKTDMRFFRKETLNNVVIMGRKTFDSLGGCLPRRHNIVVTHRFALFPEKSDCVCSGGIIEALIRADRDKTKRQDVFIIGGATMYEQFAPYVDRYLITDVYKQVPDADAFFDKRIIGPKEHWDFKVIQSGVANSDGDEADFRIYELTAKNAVLFDARRREEIEQFEMRARLPRQKSARFERTRLSA